MKIIRKYCETFAEASAFINLCERKFQDKLSQTISEIIGRGNRVITLSGPTCSGKTTTAKALVKGLEDNGLSAVVISIDDFYLDNLRANLKEGDEVDFDSVKTIDLDYLAEFITSLFSGECVYIPRFNFMTGVRDGYSKYTPKPNDVYIFEGIQAIYPEVTALLGENFTSVFINVEDEIICNGVYFAPHEIRLLRRIVRDHQFRNTTPEQTFNYWKSVRKNEIESIFPNTTNPHFIIDSFLPYELFAISSYVIPLLGSVPDNSAFKGKAFDLEGRLSILHSDVYKAEFIPEGSIFREFIG
jgi:uridine kinase